MPIYEFECPIHGRFEIILPLTKSNSKFAFCGFPNKDEQGFACGIKAERIWSLPGNIQIAKPTRMFVNNKDGSVFSPIKESDKPPKGYHEIELKGPAERSKFEKEQQHRIDGQNQLTSHILDSMKSEARKNRHDNLKSRMNAIQREVDPNTGKEIEFTLDHKDKALIEKAMNRSKKKPMKEKKSNVMLAVNHDDRSNLDEVK